MLSYIPGGINFKTDALSRLPQYYNARPEVIRPVIPSKQLAALVTTRAPKKLEHELPSELCIELKGALKGDEWFVPFQ